jgi:hypothetical protein
MLFEQAVPEEMVAELALEVGNANAKIRIREQNFFITQ